MAAAAAPALTLLMPPPTARRHLTPEDLRAIAGTHAEWGPVAKEHVVLKSDIEAEFPHVADGALVEFRVSIARLMDTDVFSKSDPLVFVTSNRFARVGAKYDEDHGMTECIRNSLNPVFMKPVYARVRKIDASSHVLRFAVLDIDQPDRFSNQTRDVYGQDYIGETRVCMADLLRLPNMRMEANLAMTDSDPRATTSGYTGNPGKILPGYGTRGVMTVQADVVNECHPHGHVSFSMSGVGLDKKDTMGKSDPYVKIFRMSPAPSTAKVLVARTETIMKTLDPVWARTQITLASLCANDVDRALMFEVYDYDAGSTDDLIGVAYTTTRRILAGEHATGLPLINVEMQAAATKKKKPYEHSGLLRFASPSFAAAPGSTLGLPAPIDMIELWAWELWNVDHVFTFLTREQKMHADLAERFRANGIDGPALVMLNESDLRTELGVTRLGERKNLLAMIAQLRVASSMPFVTS